MFIILAFFSGSISFLNMILASKVSNETGMIRGIFHNFLWATLFSLIGLFIFEPNSELFVDLDKVPLIYYTGGLLGIIINFIFNKAIPKVSSVYLVILRFIGQLLIGCTIDYLYFHIFSLGKFLGLIFFALGLAYNSFIDNKYNFLEKVYQDEKL